jgi:hypothetical protein
MSNPIRFNSKDDFAAALEACRPFWRDYDKRTTATHKTAEKAYLDQARATLRAALKMDYSTLKRTHGYSVTIGSTDRCPVLMEPKIDTALRALALTYGKTFVVSPTGGWDDAHQLLTWDPDAPKTAC